MIHIELPKREVVARMKSLGLAGLVEDMDFSRKIVPVKYLNASCKVPVFHVPRIMGFEQIDYGNMRFEVIHIGNAILKFGHGDGSAGHMSESQKAIRRDSVYEEFAHTSALAGYAMPVLKPVALVEDLSKKETYLVEEKGIPLSEDSIKLPGAAHAYEEFLRVIGSMGYKFNGDYADDNFYDGLVLFGHGQDMKVLANDYPIFT